MVNNYFFSMKKKYAVLISITIFAAMLMHCSSEKNSTPISTLPAWRLIPEACVLGQRKQFFLYGRHLDSAEISGPPSVKIEKGDTKSDGRILSIYLTATAMKPTVPAYGEKKGIREIKVKTPDTSATFELKIVDEAQPR